MGDTINIALVMDGKNSKNNQLEVDAGFGF
jgi:hypothetical protein